MTTQVVDLVRLDMSMIRKSVLHGGCDPAAPSVCYESFAEQSGEGVTVEDVSCVEAASRRYECIVQASDANGDYTVPIAASCDDTGCIWRTQ